MIFSSLPIYQDPPIWQQQQEGDSGEDYPRLVSPVTTPPPLGGDGTGNSSAKVGSMTERARLAKLPMPEKGLKCPRCESTNTKFCYFNNYSLSQPRHFCKTCRRYWTRGGTLRSVPLGGGCRRNNKRSKASTKSKSPVTNSTNSSCSCTTSNIIKHILPPPSQIPFCPSLQHLSNYGDDGGFGLTFGSVQLPSLQPAAAATEFQIGEQWRLEQVQQLPFMEPSNGVYQFEEGEGVEASNYHLGAKPPLCSEVTQLGLMMMEESKGVNLSRFNQGNDQYLGANAWTDLHGFLSTSSSSSHLL
ncbi:hypothetical protein LguiA_034967 [Lonicera macranthoides]